MLFFIFINFSVVENRSLIVSWINSCVFVIHDSRLSPCISGTIVIFSGVVWGLGNWIVISSIKRDLLGILFTLARVSLSGSSSEVPFSSSSPSSISPTSSHSVIGCECIMGVQVLVMLSHVCVCWMPLFLWLLSIGLAPAIIAWVLPQKSYGVHFGLSHDGKLQIVSSISLISLFSLGVASGCRGSSAIPSTVMMMAGEGANSGE